jgi:hypothetical protein
MVDRGAGDVNNDGYSDVIVGAPDYDNGSIAPRGQRSFSRQCHQPLQYLRLAAYGNSSSQSFGISVAGAGDVNGDGYPTSSSATTCTTSLATRSGAAVYLGSERPG